MAPGEHPLLSVLICTLARREAKLLSLLAGLLPQAERSAAPVEVVALQNQGEQPLAKLRQMLLDDARGEYLCFADDDDALSGDYIAAIVAALESRPDVVGWRHLNTGTPGKFTDVSLLHAGAPWQPVNGGYLRPFTHLNPVRSDLAKKGTFLSGGPGYTGEDLAFVWSVLPLLHREVQLPRPVYTYQWSPYDTTQNGPQAPGPPHKRPVVSSPCFRWYP